MGVSSDQQDLSQCHSNGVWHHDIQKVFHSRSTAVTKSHIDAHVQQYLSVCKYEPRKQKRWLKRCVPVCVQHNSSSFWALPCSLGSSISSIKNETECGEKEFWHDGVAHKVSILVFPEAQNCTSSLVIKEKGREQGIFSRQQEEQQRQLISKLLMPTARTLNT